MCSMHVGVIFPAFSSLAGLHGMIGEVPGGGCKASLGPTCSESSSLATILVSVNLSMAVVSRTESADGLMVGAR
jgi:hypothetical protein